MRELLIPRARHDRATHGEHVARQPSPTLSDVQNDLRQLKTRVDVDLTSRQKFAHDDHEPTNAAAHRFAAPFAGLCIELIDEPLPLDLVRFLVHAVTIP